jgi:hypothetical protein
MTKQLRCWKVNCMEDKYPGLWHTWFTEQVAAIGWAPPEFGLQKSTGDSAWRRARNCLLRIEPDDQIVVQLKDWRIGRIGTVLRLRITDDEWDPTVPRQEGDEGEMGRRIEVRWDLTTGPLAPQFAIQLPADVRPNMRIWRPLLAKCRARCLNGFKVRRGTRTTGSVSFQASQKREPCRNSSAPHRIFSRTDVAHTPPRRRVSLFLSTVPVWTSSF